MKKIILIFFTLLIATISHAQTKYDTCQAQKQYEGEWIYASGQDTIRIYLRNYRYYNNEIDQVTDRLWGWHEYRQGNTIIESDYQYRFENLPYNLDNVTPPYSVFLYQPNCSDGGRTAGVTDPERTLIGEITDSLQANESHKVKAIFNANRTVMTWQQEHSEWYGYRTGAYGMTLPKYFVLTKKQ